MNAWIYFSAFIDGTTHEVVNILISVIIWTAFCYWLYRGARWLFRATNPAKFAGSSPTPTVTAGEWPYRLHPMLIWGVAMIVLLFVWIS